MKKIEQGKLLELTIFTIASILSLIGIMSVYSAGSYFASVIIEAPFFYVQKQAIFVLLGFIACIVVLKFKYRFFTDYRLMKYISIAMFITLLVLLVFGRATKGAKGWIDLGFFSIQPMEFAKLILIWNTAFYFSETRYLDSLDVPEQANQFQQLWGSYHPEITLGIIYAGLTIPVLLQPDTGGFGIMFVTIGLMWLASGLIPWKKAVKWLVGIIVGGYVAVILLATTIGGADYRIRRILVFLNPFEGSPDDSRQIRNSFFALARGGLTGVGIGNSVQKTGYLPEARTDFILSIIGEELGILGVLFVLVLLLLLVFFIFRRSTTVNSVFDKYILMGIASMFLVQIFLNVAGVTSLAPLTGVTLPFISYGGSSMLMSFVAIGIVLKISIYNRKMQHSGYSEDAKVTEQIKRRKLVE